MNLNSYFNLATDQIFEWDGTVLNFMGDAIYVAWGVPLKDEKYADRAVEAAIDIIRKTKRDFHMREFYTRIGINSVGKSSVENNIGRGFV